LANAVFQTACSISSSELGEEILQAYNATTKIFAFENKLQYVLAKCGEAFTQVGLSSLVV